MNILITGLTLHNNKGGPALALALIERLRREPLFAAARFYMAVPDLPGNLEKEQRWADFYGVDGVVYRLDGRQLVPPFCFQPSQIRQRKAYLSLLDRMNMVIDLSALGYVDVSTRPWLKQALYALVLYSCGATARARGILFGRWTQSYGPFINPVTRFFAKRDLGRLPLVLARGEDSLQQVRALLPEKKVYSFPDIAISLPSEWRTEAALALPERYYTLSPSCVMVVREGEAHLDHLKYLIDKLAAQDAGTPVLVPHNLMTINPTLRNCDLKVCQALNERLDTPVQILDQDLDVFSLKQVIAGARFHVGARYHSIIAALSSGVPVVSFSWHEKYRDIMRMYGVEDYVFEGTESSDLLALVEQLIADEQPIRTRLATRQEALLSEIDRNVERFMEMTGVSNP